MQNKEMVIRLLKKCGITTNADGTENSEVNIWELDEYKKKSIIWKARVKMMKGERMMKMKWSRMKTMKRVESIKRMRVVSMNIEHASLNIAFYSSLS